MGTREDYKRDAENDRLGELYDSDPLHLDRWAEDVYGLDDPVFDDEPEEFGAPVGDVSGPALLEILVGLGATDIEQTATWMGFALDGERFAIERGELWTSSRELASTVSEKIRRAARERVFTVVSGG